MFFVVYCTTFAFFQFWSSKWYLKLSPFFRSLYTACLCVTGTYISSPSWSWSTRVQIITHTSAYTTVAYSTVQVPHIYITLVFSLYFEKLLLPSIHWLAIYSLAVGTTLRSRFASRYLLHAKFAAPAIQLPVILHA